MNKILKIFFILIFLITSKSYAIDDISELSEAINEAKDEFNNIAEASTEESKIIDDAIKEINKATEYAQEAINSDATDDAIKTLEFIEKSLADVERVIPQEFSSDMSKIDTSAISKEDMDTINELTSQMNVAKEKELNAFMSDLVDLNQKGIDTISISKNLNDLGIKTVNLVLDVGKEKDMKNWTKEQWADSYKGSILTSAGSEIITDKQINNKVIDLEKKLKVNNVAILDKRTSISELQTKIDPLSNQITDLKSQKTDLLAKYNKEILKQSSTVLSDTEINQSKELADVMDKQLSDITKQIEVAESQSNLFQQQVTDLNLDLTNEIAKKTELQNNIQNLSNQLSASQNLLSEKKLELDQLKNSNFDDKINSLNESLQSVSRERDFIETQFERSIDLEVQAVERYYSALGDINSGYFDKEVDFTIREVGVIMDDDPRRARAFEFEKYATYAGLSNDFIQDGIASIKNDDWGKQKELYKEVTAKLSKNPGWQVDVPSNAELNVMIQEDKAIQAAALASMQVNEIRAAWNDKVNKQVKEVGPIASLRTTTITNAATWEGMPEHEFLEKERAKLMSGDMGEKLKSLTDNLSEKQKELNQLVEMDKDKREKIKNQVSRIQREMGKNFAKMSELNSELSSKNKNFNIEYQKAYSELNAAIYGPGNTAGSTSGPTAAFEALSSAEKTAAFDQLRSLQDGKKAVQWAGLPGITQDTSAFSKEMKNISEDIISTKNQIQKLQTTYQMQNAKIMETTLKNQTSQVELQKQFDLRNEVNKMSMEKISIESEISKQARDSLVAQVQEAQEKVNEIYSQENPELKAVEQKVTDILKEVPTFAADAEKLAGLDPASLRAALTDIVNGNKNETKALEAARRAMAQVGKAPIGNLTGPTWQMTNVKAAAIVRSKKYDHVDDYAYVNAEYKDPLNLSTKERASVEKELKDLLGQENVKLEALNNKVSDLTTELNSTKTQSQNLTVEISDLEKELSSLKKSENNLQNQINDLSKEFSSKESLISEKTQNLASLQEQLNPLSEKMNKLQGQRADLNTKLNDQLNSIASQIESKGQGADKTDSLKAELESQIAELDNQLKDYESQSNEINSQLNSLTNELNTLETQNPEIANKIESLTNDLKNFKDIKADLAMATAKKLGINVNNKAIKSIEVMDGKVIVALQGTEVVKIFEKKMLLAQAANLVDPISDLSKTTVYNVSALNKDLISKEFMESAKSLSAMEKVEVLAQSTALEAAGASTEQSSKVASAQAARSAARKEWDAALASGDKAAAEAAEKAFMAARDVEQVIDQAAADSVARASVAAVQAQAAATTAAAQDLSAAAQAAAADMEDTIADATRSVQEATLEALREIESLPGATGFHSQKVQAAMEQIEAEMAGREYDFLGQSSYADAMKEIERMENTGKSVVECLSGC